MLISTLDFAITKLLSSQSILSIFLEPSDYLQYKVCARDFDVEIHFTRYTAA